MRSPFARLALRRRAYCASLRPGQPSIVIVSPTIRLSGAQLNRRKMDGEFVSTFHSSGTAVLVLHLEHDKTVWVDELELGDDARDGDGFLAVEEHGE